MSTDQQELIALLESLTGEGAPYPSYLQRVPTFPAEGLGYSQFNELLLLLGYDRVTQSLFQYLVDGSLEYTVGAGLSSIDALREGIGRVRTMSLLFFGNVKFGFKRLARDADALYSFQASMVPLDLEVFTKRHEAIVLMDEIPSDQTYFLGYMVQGEIDNKLKQDPFDEAALQQREKVDAVITKGIHNHHAYLVSDHLDVYVATSMRQRHEYLEVSEFTKVVFGDQRLKSMKVRYFDPTQAYCSDRIDKGLAEALMLKRAKCTVYLAQESDTFGKDSELASTLAQGKPVIAYVPSPREEQVRETVDAQAALYGESWESIVLKRLQAISPNLAWTNSDVRRWVDDPATMVRENAIDLLVNTTRVHYDSRASTLMESHPLGIQVNLDTGVANGVLVVRTAETCAELIFRILTGNLEFLIEKKQVGEAEYHLLREKVSKSIFRVMTGDAMLTNSFWNFYLEPAE